MNMNMGKTGKKQMMDKDQKKKKKKPNQDLRYGAWMWWDRQEKDEREPVGKAFW